MSAAYLADKSALSRMSHPAVAAWLEPRILDGDVARCSVIDLELLFSARDRAGFLSIRVDREAGFPLVTTDHGDLERAVDVMGDLAKTGRHRAASIPDLIIAATAERAGLTVVHYDRDFDIIASVTGQQMLWVQPAGSL